MNDLIAAWREWHNTALIDAPDNPNPLFEAGYKRGAQQPGGSVTNAWAAYRPNTMPEYPPPSFVAGFDYGALAAMTGSATQSTT